MHDACHGLSDSETEQVATRGELVHAEAGQTVLRAGERMEFLYLVLKGRLKLVIKTPSQGERTIRYIAAGDQLGA